MTAEDSLPTSIHCKTQESMTSEQSISGHMHTHIPNSRIPMTNNLLCSVNSSEREDCSWLQLDQGVFPAFFKMDSDTLHISNHQWDSVSSLCSKREWEQPHNSPLYIPKCHYSIQKRKIIYSGKKWWMRMVFWVVNDKPVFFTESPTESMGYTSSY